MSNSRGPRVRSDWLMGVAWSLNCGFGRVQPYFYPIYFAGLLLHREWRDSKHCAAKYGASSVYPVLIEA